MASAILERLEREPTRWPDVEVDVQPGITAAQALAPGSGRLSDTTSACSRYPTSSSRGS